MWFGLALLAPSPRSTSAQIASPQGTFPSPQGIASPLPIPPGLPVYDLTIRIEPASRRVVARERVTFTNRSHLPVSELIFHVYPRYQVEGEDKALLAKTIEALRVSPDEAMDTQGRRLEVDGIRVRGAPTPFHFDEQLDTILVVPLDQPVPPGGTVTAELDFRLDLPNKWGRWGHREGITYLANWYPVLAFHDGRGFERTPFVPWHQPFHQEAGLYTVRVELPRDQVVASTGQVVDRQLTASGDQLLTIVAHPARDFSLVCSDRFKAWERTVDGVRVRVTAFPENEANANLVLDYACEVVPLYQQWFGPYPCGNELELTTAFFGWNGNECSGLVWLDDRVMRAPDAARLYLDHLVTHETCHQWWWNAVGTDGYAETFMDEGLVNCFSALRLDAKYGRNASLIDWPQGLKWLPTIGREDLRLSGYYGWRANGNGGSALRNLDEIGNLEALFSLAYDRGGKTIEMVRNRLGAERFDQFLQKTYRAYAWRTITYEDLKRELDAFEPGAGWPVRLDDWLVEHKDVDWAVESVDVAKTDDALGRASVTVELRQNGELHEPTIVRCAVGDQEVRVPIWPERGDYEVPGARIERTEPGTWLVHLDAPGRPTQVEVDPDHVLLDARPDNNRWKPEVHWRVSPILTPLDGQSMFQPYDRVGVVAGPFVDQYARAGFRATIQRLENWQITGWAGVEPALNEMIFGGQATLFHWPNPDNALGFFYEEGLNNFHNDQQHSGGRLFFRKRILESSSFIVDDNIFVEGYYGIGNEFWPGDDGRPVNAYLGAVGARFRMSTLFPYWDPVQGYVLDGAAEYGNSLIGSDLDYVRVFGEAGKVWAWPYEEGFFAGSRFAARLYGGVGAPDTATYFRLGGGRRLRALDLARDEGASVWLVTLEWRYPLIRDLRRDFVGRAFNANNLYGALFYDVGQSYLGGDFLPVVHGVGVGLRLDATFFSFIERASFRIDIAQPVGVGTDRGPQVWLGINHIF